MKGVSDSSGPVLITTVTGGAALPPFSPEAAEDAATWALASGTPLRDAQDNFARSPVWGQAVHDVREGTPDLFVGAGRSDGRGWIAFTSRPPDSSLDLLKAVPFPIDILTTGGANEQQLRRAKAIALDAMSDSGLLRYGNTSGDGRNGAVTVQYTATSQDTDNRRPARASRDRGSRTRGSRRHPDHLRAWRRNTHPQPAALKTEAVKNR